MTISNVLAPEPFWVIINNAGTVAGGAVMFTKRSLNKVQDKIVYQDAGGTIPWTNPIVFDMNGVQGPFYWTVDTDHPEETYFIQVYEAPTLGSGSNHGPLIWDIDDFLPNGSGGGGGDVTTYIPLTNYIANNQFIDHIDDTSSPVSSNLVIAPSNHKGFTPDLINPVVSTYGTLGPDIRFVKTASPATPAVDQITFPLFIFGDDPLLGDVTPVDYIRYQCTNTPVGETFKSFQFPITQKVKNLAGQPMTLNLWAAVTTTAVDIKAYVLQYFGSGTAASSEVRFEIDTRSLTTTWTLLNMNFVVPDVATKSIGTLGQQTDDDAVYIQIEMPLNEPCDVLFTKPALYLGTVDPDLDFDDYDQINSVNSTPRTGDIKVSLSSSAPRGWVAMNDGSIGNVGSGATNRANKDTFQLYKTIWDGVLDAWAPVSTGRGANAIADFIAGKKLTLPLSLGRALAGAGTGSGLTARALGENLGVQNVALAGANLPVGTPYNSNLGNTTSLFTLGVNPSLKVPSNILAGDWSFGLGTATSNMQPTSFMNVFIKL